MPRPNQGEVTAINRGDLGNTETFRDGDYGHVSGVEASVLVEPHELGHAPHIDRKQIDQLELFNHVIKELCVYCGAHMPVDDPTSFDKNRRGQQQWSLQFLQEAQT